MGDGAGRANLHGARLFEANLRRANMRGAIVSKAQLAQTKSLEGATLPDGTVHK